MANKANRRRKLGGGFYFYKMKLEPKQISESSDHLDNIGREHFFTSKAEALKKIQKTLPQSKRNN
ncbi:MAG: hypothetical protein V7731_10445 [Amphritea sp.]